MNGEWCVVLWHLGRMVAGDSVSRLLAAVRSDLEEGKIPEPRTIVSLHCSAKVADKAAERLGVRLKASGWWLIEGAAEAAKRNQ